ncbi:MAG: cyclic nucleotide-binding domain-containing protein [bacterium]
MRKGCKQLLMEEADYRWLEKGLRGIGFPVKLGLKQMAGILPYLQLEECPNRCVVCKEGTKGDHFYLIYKGRVEVLKKGWRKPIAQLKPGEFFGEMSLLSGRRHSATVRTLKTSRFFRLKSKDFLKILRRNPSVSRAIHKIAEERRGRLARK